MTELRSMNTTNQIIEAIRTCSARIIDVRTYMEFQSGHVVNAENIPLQEIPAHVESLKNEARPIVLCCASGNRSGQATAFLHSQGVSNAVNGGTWFDVNFISQN